MNIASKISVAMRKILYYNKSFCYNRKMIILQQNILLQYRKILYHNKAFCCNRKKKKKSYFPNRAHNFPIPAHLFLSLFSLINNAISSLFSHQGPCAHTNAARRRCQSNCDSLSLFISFSPRLSLFTETP